MAITLEMFDVDLPLIFFHYISLTFVANIGSALENSVRKTRTKTDSRKFT